MTSEKLLRMGIQKTPLQKSYEMAIGAQSFIVDFRAANTQFDSLEISLVYKKSDKHNTVYDSYNVEQASTFTQSVVFEKILQSCSIADTAKMRCK